MKAVAKMPTGLADHNVCYPTCNRLLLPTNLLPIEQNGGVGCYQRCNCWGVAEDTVPHTTKWQGYVLPDM